MNPTNILIGLIMVVYVVSSKAQASKNIHQLIDFEDKKKELRTLNLHVHGKNIEVIKVGGSRVQVKTRVSISLDNLHFLNYLMEETERYKLASIPNGGEGSVNIEAKSNKAIVIQGKTCTESISYVFYVPRYIKNVQIHNLDTD